MAKRIEPGLYVRHGRIRAVKPEFFKHEGLFDLEIEIGAPIRLAFEGLWTQCDRDGRFYWRPRTLKSEILPHDDCDFTRILDALATRRYVVKYEIDGEIYGCIPSWHKHQSPNNRERKSNIPSPDFKALEDAEKQAVLPLNGAGNMSREPRVDDAQRSREPRQLEQEQGEGKGREGNKPQSLQTSDCGSSEPSASESVAAALVMTIPLNSGKEYGVTRAAYEEYQRCYPAVDVLQQLRGMRAWSNANPKNKKTKAGIERFINRWLAKEQDRAPVGSGPATPVKPAAQAVPQFDIPKDLSPNGRLAWKFTLDNLAKLIHRHSFDTWLKPLRSAGSKQGIIYVLIPTAEFAHVSTKYSAEIAKSLPDGFTGVVLIAPRDQV